VSRADRDGSETLNFDFSEDQKLLQKTARDFLTERSPLSACRSALEAQKADLALWRATAEMGWQGAVIPEEFGGAGLGYLELALIAEEIGRALAPIPFGSSVYLATEAVLLAGSDEQRKSWLRDFASGESIGTLALVERLGRPTADSIQTRLRGGRLEGTKLAVPDGMAANRAVVVAQGDGGISLALVDLGGPGVRREPVNTIDATRANALVRFDGAPAEPLGRAGQGWALLERLLLRAAVLQAFEQLGGAQRALEITRDYMLGRYAFGRPIASFQALKHRMADVYTAIELARSNAYFGAWALANDAPELGEAACSARVSALDAFELATREMIQMHGGVGYTWEYDCHLFYRRAKWLSASLGGPGEWKDRLVSHIAAGAA
jgi:alkylation response protein AidB-like acyl-CoA dehydrogenase